MQRRSRCQKVSRWWRRPLAVRGTGAGDIIQKEEGQLEGDVASKDAESMARMDKLQGPNHQHVHCGRFDLSKVHLVLFDSDIFVLVRHLGSILHLHTHADMASSNASFLGLEACHALVTGAAGGVGVAIVRELLGRIIQTY